MDTNLDAATRSLNSIRGQAMHALIMFGLYSERKRKADGGDKESPVMVDLVRNELENKLDKSKDDSLAVHSVFGWYFPQLLYLDEDWTLANLDKIFPHEEGKIQYWLAAWSAYIRFSDVYTNVFPKLIPNYQFSLQILEIEQKANTYDRLDERLAEHIMKAYLFGHLEIESPDRLLQNFYSKASDEVRSRGVFWLSQLFGDSKQGVDTVLWKRIWSLWQWRLEAAEISDTKADFTQELSDYFRILKSVPLDLKEMYDTLDKSLKYMPRQGFEIGLYVSYLAEQCEGYPDLAVDLLHKVISEYDEFYLLQDAKDNITKIFGEAENASGESKQKVIELVNIFGERGDYSWRPWLEKMG